MPFPESRPAVVLLPDAAPFRALVAQAIQRAEAELLPANKAAEAEIAVVDVRVPGGPAAVKELLAASEHNDIAVLAVVDWADPRGVDEARELGALDLLGAEHLEEELPIRLRMAHQRRQKRIELRQSKKHLSLVLKLTADYAESHDVVELLHDVTRRLAEEMDILRASLVVLDEEQAAGFVIAASDDAALKSLKIELARYPEIREVVRTGKPVLVEDVPTHPLLEGVKSHVASRGIRAIAALPLALHGKVLGVLLLRAAGRRRGFTQHEMDLLATVAHATAVALRNVRLLESQRGHLAREKSARIAAEERAAQLERYEAFFANISEGIAILDDQARLISINPAGTRMLDLDAQDARGQHITALTNPTDEGVLMDTLWAIARGEPRRELDLAVRTGAGHRLTLAACAAPMRDGDAAAILSFRDVTVQRQLADELRQTKDFLERLIDSSVDGIIAADMKGRVILYNKGAEAICGYTPEEALAGLNVSDIYPPKVAREVMGRLRGLESGGKGRLSATRLELFSKSGERVPVNMTASIIFEEEREVATVGIFTDLRDRVQLERKLSDAETRLEESERNAVIVALAGTAAHELNQPLTSVMGYAELLKRKLKESDFAYRPVDIIYREAERMAEIVRKIGKITRYETKSYVGSAKILDLDKASSHEE